MQKSTGIAIVLILTIVVAFFLMNNEQPPILGDVHKHANFKVYLEGKEYDFKQEKYMSNKNKSLSNFIHLHDMDGGVVHQHIKKIRLGQFFNSIGLEFNATCFVLDNGNEYCNNNNQTIKFYVNGVKRNEFETYEFNDLDRILITYGNEDESIIRQQIESVADTACIHSEKCPERGRPSDESSCSTSNENCREV